MDDALLVEVKSVAALVPLHDAQTLTYLRMTGLAVGLLLNFNVPLLKDGLRRFARSANNRSAPQATPITAGAAEG